MEKEKKRWIQRWGNDTSFRGAVPFFTVKYYSVLTVSGIPSKHEHEMECLKLLRTKKEEELHQNLYKQINWMEVWISGYKKSTVKHWIDFYLLI